MQDPIRTDRKLRMWEYRVSHDQLLLRSPKDGASRNLDIVFVGVQYVALPARLDGVEIGRGTEDDVLRAEQACGKPVAADRVFSVHTGGGQYMIVAASVRMFENDLDMFESSLESFTV